MASILCYRQNQSHGIPAPNNLPRSIQHTTRPYILPPIYPNFIHTTTNNNSPGSTSDDSDSSNFKYSHQPVTATYLVSRRNSSTAINHLAGTVVSPVTLKEAPKDRRYSNTDKKRVGRSLDRNNNAHQHVLDRQNYYQPYRHNSSFNTQRSPSSSPSPVSSSSSHHKTTNNQSNISAKGDIHKNEGIITNTHFIKPIRSKYDLEDQFTIHQQIGNGNFSEVYLLTDKTSPSNTRYALKEINKSKMEGKSFFVENEVHILKSFQHPNICKLVDAYYTKSTYLLIFELASKGDLFEAIKKLGHFSENTCASIIHQLALALKYLHSNGVIHRDIKPENIFLQHDLTVKLADFGLACFALKHGGLKRVCGTPTYVAPEILSPKPEGYSFEVDCWSMGILLHIMLVGFAPFRNSDRNKLFKQICKGTFNMNYEGFIHISPSAKNLLLRLITVNPVRRLTSEQVLKHDWIQNHMKI